MEAKQIECCIMRGGTSKGVFVKSSHLPDDRQLRNGLLQDLLGRDTLQFNGIGGAHMQASKAVLIDSCRNGVADISYRCVQVVPSRGVDDGVPCGNLAVAAGPGALEMGLLPAVDPTTTVRMIDVNTQARIDVTVQTPGAQVTYQGSHRLHNMGCAAPIEMSYLNIAGSRTGRMWPAGAPKVNLLEVPATIIDAAVPVVIVPAYYLGLSGSERARELAMGNRDLVDRLLALRSRAARMIGMRDVSRTVLPKIALIAAPDNMNANLRAWYFTPQSLHHAMPITGSIAIASAACTPGTVVADLASGFPRRQPGRHSIRIEHISGAIDLDIELAEDGTPHCAHVVSTARLLMRGVAYLPEPAADLAPETGFRFPA
ncbi:MAG: 4-oxalomesaconate tautomerase, partial [Betaproteobacteria bacterium]|nr:4-oxalomesaconate tautomerase [Betaproteobacteria bacterium]